MAKHSKKAKPRAAERFPAPSPSPRGSPLLDWTSGPWLPLLLAVIAFGAYLPALKYDLVYDARNEILEEGFVTSASNLPAVLSLKVLGMNLILGDRPGQMLYLMLIAMVSGKDPFGYHLCSNLLHAANVALLFVFLRRLAEQENSALAGGDLLKARIATVAVSLVFALHPLAVEPVAAVSYSSDLLVTFFTLLTLLAATSFRPDNLRVALLTGSAGALCAFASVACKESGAATALLLVVYWFLFRRAEAKGPWLCFIGAAVVLTSAFLALRFLWAPPNPAVMTYLGGSLSGVLLIQPRLWVYMMGKWCWPTQFSADYTLGNVSDVSTPLALAILTIVLVLQLWLATRSRIGALGIAIFWLGLATVSNFIPLYRILGDRFYYLPLAGISLQLLALLLMALRSSTLFWTLTTCVFASLLPLTWISLDREKVFSSDESLWSDTIRISPDSWLAHSNLGVALEAQGNLDEAIAQFQTALEIKPGFVQNNVELSNIYLQRGQLDEAIVQCRTALAVVPGFARAYYNLGNALARKGQLEDAVVEYKSALAIDPHFSEAFGNLGNALLQLGQTDEAIVQFQKALEFDSTRAEIHNSLAAAYLQKNDLDTAILEFQKALNLKPDYTKCHDNLGRCLAQKGRMSDAITEFKKALALNPDFADAHTDLGNALLETGDIPRAIFQFEEVVRLKPGDPTAQSDLAKTKAMTPIKTPSK